MGEILDIYLSNKNVIDLLKGNDKFSNFKGMDLQELINLIESFYLIYRPTLNLDENVTFGTEIEYQQLARFIVNKHINNNYPNWVSTNDLSIGNGGEIISPKLNDSSKTWVELQEICNFLKENNGQSLDRTGSHIHAGSHIFKGDKDKVFEFIETYVAYEKILSRFFYGEYLCAREYLGLKMKYMTKQFAYVNYDHELGKLSYVSVDSFLKKLNKGFVIKTEHSDFSSVEKTGNTMELRVCNGTLEEIIWQNNINAYTKMLLAVINNKIDIDLVKYKIKNEFIGNLNDNNLYNKIYVDDALEFVDMVFDNNLDKVYFLRQYFKNFEVVLDSKQLVKAKSFIDKTEISKIKIA